MDAPSNSTYPPLSICTACLLLTRVPNHLAQLLYSQSQYTGLSINVQMHRVLCHKKPSRSSHFCTFWHKGVSSLFVMNKVSYEIIREESRDTVAAAWGDHLLYIAPFEVVDVSPSASSSCSLNDFFPRHVPACPKTATMAAVVRLHFMGVHFVKLCWLQTRGTTLCGFYHKMSKSWSMCVRCYSYFNSQQQITHTIAI